MNVSKQGLAQCPGCQTHIKVSTPIAATVCPFCSHAFADVEVPKRKRLTKGRSLLAAALLGSTVTLSACPPPATPPYGQPPRELPEERPTPPDGGTSDGEAADGGTTKGG